jgi:Holliday junction resolvase
LTKNEDQRGHIPVFRSRSNNIVVKSRPIKIKPKPDYKKVNKTRKSRGYSFEKTQIVQAFNTHPSGEWNAKRLGGATTHLPDIVVTNNANSILYSIEAKSGDTDRLYIPRDEIERCIDITTKFLSSYRNRYVVLAFKFKGNKALKRKLQYRFIISDNIETLVDKTLKYVCFNLTKNRLIFQYENKKIGISVGENGIKSIDSIQDFVEWQGWMVTV